MSDHADRLDAMVEDVKRRAANPEYVWDTRAIDWPLDEQSTVVEVGGYCGRWALQIVERYHPRLFVFEPQQWAWNVCATVLADSATVLNYGLGDRDVVLPMGNWETDGCSLVNVVGTQSYGQVRETKQAFKSLEIAEIDLLLMNIEGYEYTLLPYMLDKGILPRRLMVQYHLFGDPYGLIMAQHWTRLEELGYKIAWTYGIMLTAWER